MASSRQNLWPFSSPKKAQKPRSAKPAITVGQAMKAAYDAGWSSGDPKRFRAWLNDEGFRSYSHTLIAKLKREYDRGVDAGGGGHKGLLAKTKAAYLEGRYGKRTLLPEGGGAYSSSGDKKSAAERRRQEARAKRDAFEEERERKRQERERLKWEREEIRAKRELEREREDSRRAEEKRRAAERKKADEANRQFLERQERERTRRIKTASATYKGKKIEPRDDGSWVVPSIDRDSHFDTLQDAKDFINSWKRNPKHPGGLDPANKYLQIANKYFEGVQRKLGANQVAIRWRGLRQSGRAAEAGKTMDGSSYSWYMSVPKPTDAERLYIFLHECGHLMHPEDFSLNANEQLIVPDSTAELHAATFARDAFLREGLKFPRGLEDDAYGISVAILQDAKGCLPIDPRAREFAGKELSESAYEKARSRCKQNPCGCRVVNPIFSEVREIENPVTDRAHRYRAQRLAPAGPKVCALCGSKKNIVPDHKDGYPDHTTPSNLQWLCKSCNTAKGFAFRNAGKGRLTHQYNPVGKEPPTYEQYLWAVAHQTGREYIPGRGWTEGDHGEAGAIIHATPKALRSEYASRAAGLASRTKKARADERWNPADRSDAIPVLPVGPDGFDSVPSQADFPSESEAIAYAQAVKEEHPGVGVLGRIDGATKKPVYGVIFDFGKLRESNPAKFDRCVKEVQARGGHVNAYAVCTAAGTRNPAYSDSPDMEVRLRQAALPRGGYQSAWSPWLYFASMPELNGYLREMQDTANLRRVTFKWEVGRKEPGGWSHLSADVGKIKPQTKGKRNPESAAAALYESFHGVPSTTILEIEELEADHGNLALLGRLVDCWVVTLTGFLAHFEFDENPPVWCSSSENGKQLYFVGGDQAIDLAAFKMDGGEWTRDRMVIGQFAPPMCGKCGEPFEKRGKTFSCPKCGKKVTYEEHDLKDVVYNLGYNTAKEFDGMEPIDYQHDLGEETGVRPMLEYDPRTKHLYVTGGQYRIEQPLFETSPGIEN